MGGLIVLATLIVVAPLILIFAYLIREGLGAMNLDFFTKVPAPEGETGGGLANAIVGSLILAAMGTLIGTPVGIMAGIYLAEYGNTGWVAPATRFVSDILLSAPSIVIGLFIYSIIVVNVKHFSGWAGTLALSLIVIPVVTRTTENMLRLVPDSLRELKVGDVTVRGSNLSRDARYDQILHLPTLKSRFTNYGGTLDFYGSDKNIRELFPDAGYTREAFSFQLSDHFPVWVQINVDIDGDRLQQIVQNDPR